MIILILNNFCYSQISAVQDSKGESSINLFQSNANLNFSTEEVAGYFYHQLNPKNEASSNHLTFGGGLSFTAAKGKSVLLSNSEFDFKGSLSGVIGYEFHTDSDMSFYPYFQVKLTRKALNVWDSTSVSVDQVYLTNKEFQLGCSYTPDDANIVLSVGFKFGSVDNGTDLTKAKFGTTLTSGGKTLTIDEKEAVGPSSSLVKNVNDMKLLADFIYVHKRIGVPVMLRYTMPDSNTKRNFASFGTGLLINKSEDESNKFLGGLVLEVSDLTKQNTDDTLGKRLTLAVVVGFPFN